MEDELGVGPADFVGVIQIKGTCPTAIGNSVSRLMIGGSEKFYDPSYRKGPFDSIPQWNDLSLDAQGYESHSGQNIYLYFRTAQGNGGSIGVVLIQQ